MQIVKVYKDEPRAGTCLISQGFNRRHAKVVELIKKYEKSFLEFEKNKSLSKGLITNKVSSKKAAIVLG